MRPDPLERATFARLVEVLGRPVVRLGSRTIEGAAWDCVTDADRQALLSELDPYLLVTTPGGAARAWRWNHDPQAKAVPLSDAERRFEARDQVHLFGDEDFLDRIVDGLAMLPAHVYAAVMTEVAFLSVGLNSAAWFGSSYFADINGRRLPHIVLLGPTATARTVVHESAHAWLSPLPSDERIPHLSVQGVAGLFAHARSEGWEDRVRDHEDSSELLAEALTVIWAGECRQAIDAPFRARVVA